MSKLLGEYFGLLILGCTFLILVCLYGTLFTNGTGVTMVLDTTTGVGLKNNL